MNVTSFEFLTEFGAALAGFSGVALAISHRGGELNGPQRFRTACLIAWALAPTFGATFPAVLEGIGLSGEQVWRASSAMFAFVASLVVIVPFRLRRGLNAAERSQLSPVIWFVSVGGNLAIVALLAFNVVGPALPGILAIGLLWHLALAALLFTRMLLAPAA